jgi:ubiquinone biosynthesis protein
MLRLGDIINVVIKYRLDEYLFRGQRTKLLLFAGNSIRSLFSVKTIEGSVGFRIRKALEELGPVFVKFGQMLSTRPDLVPPSIIQELVQLREAVEPFDSDLAIKILEDELKAPIAQIFTNFDRTPVAAGSVAQVHYATLITGEEVAVKILRPDIEQKIKQDIALFRQATAMVEIYKPDIKRLKVPKIIDELSVSILSELDLEIEANSIIRFAENMKEFDYIRVPKVYSNFSGKNVLIMERMTGVPINQVDVLRSQGVDIDQLVAQGVEALMVQVFRDGFFHADQHPGNLWVQSNGSRIYLDFGIMGSMSEQDRRILLKVLFSLYTKNYKKVISTMIEAGWITDDLNTVQIEDEIIKVGDAVVNRKQKDFSLGTVVSQLFRSLEKFDAKVPYQFTLLAKTILVVEGVSKEVAPDLNIQAVAEPILLRHFARQGK